MKSYQFLLELKNKVSAPAKQMQQSIGGIVAKIDAVNEKMTSPKGMTGSISKMKQSLSGLPTMIAGAFAVGSIVSFGKEVVNTLAEFEKMEAVLTNTLGSNSAAQAALSQIKAFAASTPFQVDELTESFVKLANQNFKPTMSQMTAMGDLASSTGKEFDQLAEAFIDAKVGEFERLKSFGIRAAKQGDLVSFSFKGQTTTVKNTDAAIQDYLLSLGKAKGVQGAMAAISETTGGKLSNLSDKFTNLKLSIGQKLQPIIHKVIDALSMMIDKLETMVAWVAANQETILTMGAAALKLTAVVYGVAKVVQIASFAFNAARTAMMVATGVYKAFAGILAIVRNAQMLFNIVLMANPIGLVIAAVVALGTVLYVLVTHWDSIKDAILRVTTPLIDLIDSVFPNFKTSLSSLTEWFKWAFDKISWIISPVVDSIMWVVDNVKALTGGGGGKKKSNSELPKHTELPIPDFPVNNTIGNIKQNSSTNLGAGGAKDRQSATANIVGSKRNVTNNTINIENLVKAFTVQTTNMKESSVKVKDLIIQALLEASNDMNHGT